jgi:hypothetical protein
VSSRQRKARCTAANQGNDATHRGRILEDDDVPQDDFARIAALSPGALQFRNYCASGTKCKTATAVFPLPPYAFQSW